nr:hypothetical protein [Actinomycetota bacterium]
MPSSRRKPQPESPPEFFLDRGLGRYKIPHALVDEGLIVHTLASVYGDDAEESVVDEIWISDAAAMGWILLTKDRGIRYVDVERESMINAGARIFCISRSDLTAEVMIEWLLRHKNRILQRARKPLGSGERTAKRFRRAGTYRYRCARHSSIVDGACRGMCGIVHVSRG